MRVDFFNEHRQQCGKLDVRSNIVQSHQTVEFKMVIKIKSSVVYTIHRQSMLVVLQSLGGNLRGCHLTLGAT